MEAILQAREINFAYRKGEAVIEDFSADFRAGDITAITGYSGRGKSTLLYILGLMLMPGSGSIAIEGVNLSQLSDTKKANLRANLYGFVFQDSALDPTRTVIDNVVENALYRGASRAKAISRAEELLAEFGVSYRAKHRPGQISGGQAQRIALCRALLNNPLVLVADEPTGNLDHTSASVVVEAFREQARAGGTVIIATHDPYLISQSTRQITL